MYDDEKLQQCHVHIIAKVPPTGFEPVQLALCELESHPLDHSGTAAKVC